MIQTVYFKLYCYVKMHKMGKLLKNCGGRVLQDNLMESWLLKISFRDSFMGVSLHYQLRKRRDEMEMEMPCGYNLRLPNQRSVFA